MTNDNLFRSIWEHPLAREFVLAVVSVLAVQLAIGLGSFVNILDTSVSVFTDLQAWGVSFGIVLVKETLKQSAVFVIQKLGKIPVTGRPGTRTPGESPGEALGLSDGKP